MTDCTPATPCGPCLAGRQLMASRMSRDDRRAPAPEPARARLWAYTPWTVEQLVSVCRRSMLPVVNCAGCQLGLHAPPPL